MRNSGSRTLKDVPVADSIRFLGHDAVTKRKVQCLYLYEDGEKLPNTHEVRVASMEGLAQLGPEKAQEFRRDFVEPLAQQELKLVVDIQFAYSVINTSRPFVSV